MLNHVCFGQISLRYYRKFQVRSG